MNDEIKRNIIDEGYYSENNYPFIIKPNFSTLGSIIEITQTVPVISFVLDDSIGRILGFNETIFYKEYSLSPNIVDIISFHNNFIECDIAQGMIFRGKRSGIIHNFTMDVSPGYRLIEKFRGGVQWYKMETKAFVSSISFILKNQNTNLVSFDGQSVTFRLAIKKV